MSDDAPDLEGKVMALTAEVAQLGQRLAALEAVVEAGRFAAPSGAATRAAATAPGARAPQEEDRPVLDAGLIGTALSLGGRTFLVLAGAFVLRALTDSGTLPASAGVALGLGYAATWAVLAARAARAGPALGATVHGLAALLIAFPLLYEASARFGLLGPVAAAAALAAGTTALLAIAAWRRLHALAWLVTLGSLATALAFTVQSERGVPAALSIIVLGAETLWIGYLLDWWDLRWPVAAVADLATALVALRALTPATAEGPGVALPVQAVLLVAYLGSIALRTLVLRRGVVVFEVVQAVGALLAGLGGAVFVALRSGSSAGGFGLAAAALGLAAYGVALAFAARREADRANFPFYAWLGLLLLGSGTAMLLPPAGLGVAWGGLALVSAVLARRSGRLTLAAHAAVFGLGAAVASALAGGALEAIAAPVDRAWPPPAGPAWLALAALAGSAWLLAASPARLHLLARLPQLALLAAGALGLAGLACAVLVPLLAGQPGPEAAPAIAATVRTAVLVLTTLLLTWAGRSPDWREAGWLTAPALGLTGLKILLEDLRGGRPAMLILTFALYGAALILVSRLRPRRAPPGASGGGHPPAGPA